MVMQNKQPTTDEWLDKFLLLMTIPPFMLSEMTRIILTTSST